MTAPNPEQIAERFLKEVFSQRIMDNTLRGYWCEFMLAEALGDEWSCVSAGWHAWDLQYGPSDETFPKRIRLQVKNSAATQLWNVESARKTNCVFNLTWRRAPFYFDQHNQGIPIEPEGFMCEAFILCHHPVEDFDRADHRDPRQWNFYIVPVAGEHSAITEAERENLRKKLVKSGKPATTQRKPMTLSQGIRGRHAVDALCIEDISTERVMLSLGVPVPNSSS